MGGNWRGGWVVIGPGVTTRRVDHGQAGSQLKITTRVLADRIAKEGGIWVETEGGGQDQ